jgi:hypothetical protein
VPKPILENLQNIPDDVFAQYLGIDIDTLNYDKKHHTLHW